MTNFACYVGLFATAILAGAINSMAGGGSLISFPILVMLGMPAVLANATNTAAVWPGAVSSAIAYRRDIQGSVKTLLMLLLPSIVGGLLGAVLLIATPPALFRAIVPFIVLGATVLFAFRKRISRFFVPAGVNGERVSWLGYIGGLCFQLFVATYGGYFGSGIGILMLASLSIMGLSNIHRMNGIKTILGSVINVVAFVLFAVRGLVVWHLALIMGLGTILGGFFGARVAKRIDQSRLGAIIVFAGVVLSSWLFMNNK
jgi:uncharacterized membrane protein YfcA